MQSKILLKRTLLLVVILSGLTLSIALLFYSPPKNSIQGRSTQVIENATVISNQKLTNSGLPVRLKIPRIHVDVPVEYVGLTSEGAMGAPKERANVGWFNLGPHPGENGSAVIAGHYGWKDAKGSAFDDLYKLRKGDTLYIEDDNGAIISFVVRESRRYNPKENASEVFDSHDGKPHLNLITCEGIWNKISKSYSKRLVVFADKE